VRPALKFDWSPRVFKVFPGEQLDGNGCATMGPAIESPYVLEGNWCVALPWPV
jgi:hypothetical protein